GAARLTELQSAVRIAIDEYSLDGDFLRLVLRHDGANTAEYFAQARRKFPVRRANDAARDVRQARSGSIQYAESGALRARIDTQDSHRRVLKRQASGLPRRGSRCSSLKFAWPCM